MLSLQATNNALPDPSMKSRTKPQDTSSFVVRSIECVMDVSPYDTPVNDQSSGHVTGLSRTKSLFSMSSTASSTSSESALTETEAQARPKDFGRDLRICLHDDSGSPTFDSAVRKAMEPYLRRARLQRERSRNKGSLPKVDASIAGSVGVPYTPLRVERPFLFDEHSYPLHEILAQTLQVDSLANVHELHLRTQDLLKPLLDPHQRRAFHEAYDGFVTSFCIPLLHSLAIAKNILSASSSSQIVYRYQAFPSIRVLQPGEIASAPICDTAVGHSLGCLRFHIPLTPSFASNALYAESHPGREDWHPLTAKSVGLGYLFDGARCLHFELENTTKVTRVSLDFCVIIYREFYGRMTDDGGLCPEELIEDRFAKADPHFYEEAVIDLGRSSLPGLEIVVKKSSGGMSVLDQPISRYVGVPFLFHDNDKHQHRHNNNNNRNNAAQRR